MASAKTVITHPSSAVSGLTSNQRALRVIRAVRDTRALKLLSKLCSIIRDCDCACECWCRYEFECEEDYDVVVVSVQGEFEINRSTLTESLSEYLAVALSIFVVQSS